MAITYRQHKDARDGKIYNCVLMPDGKWWSAENLAWAGAGICYNNDPALGAIYGRLYSWNEALVSCPPGSHLPGDAEWTTLETAIPDPDGTKLKANSTLWVPNTGTDGYGFCALPGGYFNGTSFYYVGEYGEWWSATEYDYSLAWDRGMDSYHANVYRHGNYKTNRFSVRFIVDTFNEPAPFKLFGAGFQGFERDSLSVTIQRPIQIIDSIGGSVVLIPYGPDYLDEWQIETELWVNSLQAIALESAVPPFGVPSEQAIRIPARGGAASFPGLMPATVGTSADTYLYPQVTSFESLGRKAPRVDLFGYRLKFTLRTKNGVAVSNPSTKPITTPPEWLQRKFATHQIQDWSAQSATVTANGFTALYPSSRHGRRKNINVSLDNLTQDRANELTALFRGVRQNPVTIAIDTGPAGIQSIPVYLTDLTMSRPNLLWEGTLEAVVA